MLENNKKVLILIQYLSPGGIEWMVAHLAEGLHGNRAWQPFVFVYDQNGIEPIDSFFLNKKIPFTRMQKANGFSIKTIMKLFQLVRRENISVVHVHHLGALMMASFVKFLIKALTLKSIKIVYTQHSFIHLARFPRYRLFEKIFSIFADQITVVSEQVQNEFKTYNISKRESILIPNGSAFPKQALSDFSELTNERIALMKSENITAGPSPTENWLLYLSRIHRGKGQDNALELWGNLSPTVRAQTNLIFIGPVTDKLYASELKARIATSPDHQKIYFLNPTLQASRWMLLSNIFISSSASEGWPMAVLEAIGCGIPALLSNIQGHQMYQDWASFYDLSAPLYGAKQIEHWLHEQGFSEKFSSFRKKYWDQSANLRKQFSIETMVKKFEKIYDL